MASIGKTCLSQASMETDHFQETKFNIVDINELRSFLNQRFSAKSVYETLSRKLQIYRP